MIRSGVTGQFEIGPAPHGRTPDGRRRPSRFAYAAKNANARASRLGCAGRVTGSEIEARVVFYGGRCWRCGAEWNEIDHVKALVLGGLNLPANIRPACTRCNRDQRNVSPEWARELALRGGHALKPRRA